MSEHCCFTFLWSEENRNSKDKTKLKFDDCPGILGSFPAQGYPEDGYYVEVCPRAEYCGRNQRLIEFNGLGPDVITLYRDTLPTPEEITEAAKLADESCW